MASSTYYGAIFPYKRWPMCFAFRLFFAIFLCAFFHSIQCQQFPDWFQMGLARQEEVPSSNGQNQHSSRMVVPSNSFWAPSQSFHQQPPLNWPQNTAAGFIVAHPQQHPPSQFPSWTESSRQQRKGLSRLLEEFSGRKGEDDEQEGGQVEEEEHHLWHQTGPQLSPDMNRPPLSTNLERYMPLLANKHRPPTKTTRNATKMSGGGGGGGRGRKNGGGAGGQHHLIDSLEMLAPVPQTFRAAGGPEEAEDEEEDESMEATNAGGGGANGGIPADQLGPCVTANCRTWITITIPSELVGIPPGIGLPGNGGAELPQQKPDGKGATGQLGKISTNSKTMPPFPPQPMPSSSKSRGLPSPKNRPTPQSPLAGGTSTPATTRSQPPDFVFSTKWILPVNGVSLRPSSNISASPSPVPIITTAMPPSAIGQITTATPTVNGKAGAGGNPWGERPPFTIRPKLPSPTQSSSSSAGPLPRERPPSSSSAKTGPRPKPWTHSSSSSTNSKAGPKARPLGPSPAEKSTGIPRPPTPDTTIEQAAIWASTELIDAIREALAKFRATLNRNGGAAAQADEYGIHGQMGTAEEMMDPEQAERELQAQLKAAWDTLRGTWLEQAVAELAQQADALGGGQQQQMGTKLSEMLLNAEGNIKRDQPTKEGMNEEASRRRGEQWIGGRH